MTLLLVSGRHADWAAVSPPPPPPPEHAPGEGVDGLKVPDAHPYATYQAAGGGTRYLAAVAPPAGGVASPRGGGAD